MSYFAPSELIINADGSIYHLNLRPEQLAPIIITVGDPDRVEAVSKYFDRIDEKVQKREFVTHTGYLGNQRITVISTGIGTDNIDIVMTELDALVNIDFNTRTRKNTLTSLQIIRIGTSGALQPDLPLDSFLASSFGMGLDGLLLYYKRTLNEAEQLLQSNFAHSMANRINLPIPPYFAQASFALLHQIGENMQQGITVTCPGFYGPQGRILRIPSALDDFLSQLRAYTFDELRFTNFEMETAGIYGMANVLGHQAISCNALIANRANGKFSKDSKKTVDLLIQSVLEKLSN